MISLLCPLLVPYFFSSSILSIFLDFSDSVLLVFNIYNGRLHVTTAHPSNITNRYPRPSYSIVDLIG